MSTRKPQPSVEEHEDNLDHSDHEENQTDESQSDEESSESQSDDEENNADVAPVIVDEPEPKPLDDNDVMEITARLATLDAKEINEICDGYTRQIKKLLTVIKDSLDPKEDEDELVQVEQISRIVNMCPKDDLFIRSKDKIWHARKHILARNADWFLKRDYSKLIKKDQKQRMIETMIRMVQGLYSRLTKAEKDFYWDRGFEMLHLVARFKKLTGE